MLFDEDQVGDDDVRRRQRIFAARKGGGAFGPFSGGMNGDGQPREVARQTRCDACRRARRMLVQRDHNDVVANLGASHGGISAHNVPLPHTGFRR